MRDLRASRSRDLQVRRQLPEMTPSSVAIRFIHVTRSAFYCPSLIFWDSILTTLIARCDDPHDLPRRVHFLYCRSCKGYSIPREDCFLSCSSSLFEFSIDLLPSICVGPRAGRARHTVVAASSGHSSLGTDCMVFGLFVFRRC